MNTFIHHKQLLIDLHSRAQSFLRGQWDHNGAWGWLDDLVIDFGEYDEQNRDVDIDTAYFMSLVESLDTAHIENVSRRFQEMTAFFDGLRNDERLTLADESFRDGIAIYGFSFHLNVDGVNMLSAKTSFLPEELQTQTAQVFDNFFEAFIQFSEHFGVVAGLLLYYVPTITFRDFDEMMEVIKDSRGGDEDDVAIDIWMDVFRFLGQGFFSSDGDIHTYALYFLLGNTMTDADWKNPIIRYQYLLYLFITYRLFATITVMEQEQLLALHTSDALQFGVPLTHLLREFLGQVEFLPYYLANTDMYAKSLKQSTERVLLGQNNPLTVGMLVSAYDQTSDETYVLPDTVKEYVRAHATEHTWSPSAFLGIDTLLFLYANLNERTIVDYKGFLSENGEATVYDWKQVMTHDIDKNISLRVDAYLRYVNVPTRMKVEIQNAIGSVPWQEEPYFSRALALDEIYTTVFGEPEGPLVMFDEPTQTWKLRKEIIQGPWKEYREQTKKDDPPTPLPPDV